jgi:hypothetical protein
MTETPFTVTFFDHRSAQFKREQTVTLGELKELIENSTAERKDLLPWVKFAVFGELRTKKGNSLRNDANVRWPTGCEADYDREQIPFDEAVATVKKAGFEALIYTSPSHLPNKPRWRILCRFSGRQQPERRAQMVARINGLFRGELAAESFTLSQSYYYGHVVDADGKPVAYKKNGAGVEEAFPTECRVELIEGQPLDLCDELDRGAIGKSGRAKSESGNGSGGDYAGDYTDLQELVRRIHSGESLDPSVASIAGKYARIGRPIETCIDLISAAFTMADQTRYGGRWKECDDCIHAVYTKERRKREAEANGTQARVNDIPGTSGLPFRLPIDIVPVHKLWLIKGVFARDEVSSTIGRPGGGKSALLVDKGVHLARGGPLWRGYKIKQRCGVIFFALERGKLVERRIQAYKLRGDLPDDAPFGVINHIIDLLNANCVSTILDTIKAFEDRTQIETGLLIFDTYSKGIAAGAGDEDKAKDQNRVAANLRRVIEKKSVHIAGVGHTGKDESRGERGSNARLADVDVQETVNGNDKTIRTVTVTKANDQDEGLLTSFVLERITLGVDEDGEEEWTYIVDPQKVPEPTATKKLGRPKGSAQARVALSALELAMSELGRRPPPSNHIPSGVRTLNLGVWKDYFLRRSVAGTEKTESRDKAFNRAVNSLQADDLIGIWGDQVWLIGQ